MRIAILGSSPSSLPLAPFEDASWTIWGCSPGAAPFVKRADAYFELHRWDGLAESPEFSAFLARMPKVYMAQVQPNIPNSVLYPKDEMVERFGPHFFSSTIAWMLALAISQNPEEIGLWGVDMAHDTEYAIQKPGCHYFISLAKAQGIKVTVPDESDLLQPAPLYGFCTLSPRYRKFQVRRDELMGRLQANLAQTDNLVREAMFLKGAVNDIDYVMRTWV